MPFSGCRHGCGRRQHSPPRYAEKTPGDSKNCVVWRLPGASSTGVSTFCRWAASVGQAVSPAIRRWTKANVPPSKPTRPKLGFVRCRLWFGLSDSQRAGNDRRTRPAKKAARFCSISGLRLWPSIPSTSASAGEPRPAGESANVAWPGVNRDGRRNRLPHHDK